MKNLVKRKSQVLRPYCLIMAVLVGIVIFSGCSEDEIVIQPGPSTVELSGILSHDGTPVDGALVTAYRADPPNTPVTVTDTDAAGSYTATIILGVSTHFTFDKLGYAVLNTQYRAFSENTSGLDFEVVLAADAETVIDIAFDGMGLDLADKAWLAIDVQDASGDDVAGVTITPDSSPNGGGTLNCDGTLSGGNTTADPACVSDRTGPMYLAYYDADTEITIAISGSSAISAPVRLGAVTFIVVEQ